MFGGCEIQQLRYFQKMQFSREAFVCNGCIFTAVFTIRMNGQGTGKMQRAFFKWNAVKDSDIFLLACNAVSYTHLPDDYPNCSQKPDHACLCTVCGFQN